MRSDPGYPDDIRCYDNNHRSPFFDGVTLEDVLDQYGDIIDNPLLLEEEITRLWVHEEGLTGRKARRVNDIIRFLEDILRELRDKEEEELDE